MLTDIDGADGGNIGCKLMSNVPRDDDRFTDLIVNGIPLLSPCLSLSAAACIRHVLSFNDL